MSTFTDAEIRALIDEYGELRDRATALSEAEKERYAQLKNQLEAMHAIQSVTQADLDMQQTIVDTLAEKVRLNKELAGNHVRVNALREEETRLARQELEYLQEQAMLAPAVSADLDERINTLKKILASTEKQVEANQQNEDLIYNTTGALEGKMLNAILRVGDMMDRSMTERLQAASNAASSFADRGLAKVASLAKDLIVSFDKLTKDFERQTQMGSAYTKSIESQYKALNVYGVSLEDAIEAQTSLISTYTDFTMATTAQRDRLTEVSVIMAELGVKQADFSKGVQNSTKFFGLSADAASETQRELVVTARELGRVPSELAAEFAQAGGSLAKFGEDGVKAFKDLSRISKLTGMEMEKVLSITNRFDTFEGAAEMAGQLNAALGGNFVNAMDMMMETDPAARFESIRQSILGAGLSFDDMSYYQKQFYTESLGLSDVGDLALMLSGNFDDLAGATNKSAEELIKEKERAKEVQSAQEQLAIVGAQVAEAFLPLVNIFQSIADFATKYTWAIKTAVPIMIAYKSIMAMLAIEKGIYAIATGSMAAAEEAQAVSGRKSVKVMWGIAAVLAAIGIYMMIASPSKLVLAFFALAAAFWAVSQAGPTTVATLQALSKPLMQVGLGVFLVTSGLGLMAAAFSLLNIGEMAMMGGILIAIGVGLYFLAPALATIGTTSMVAGPGLLMLGAAVLMIGGAIGIAAAGIGLMAEGLALMFTAIEVDKMVAFGAMVGALVLGAPFMIMAGIGLGAMAIGMGALAFSLKFISTRDLEAIALFSSSLAELSVGQIKQVSKALREVAKAMDDVPTHKAIMLTATMNSAATAAKAANILAGKTEASTPTAAAAAGSTRPIDVHVTLELDGEVLDRRIVKVNKKEMSTGGVFSAVGQILG